jgi:hypothetical protein
MSTDARKSVPRMTPIAKDVNDFAQIESGRR